MLRKEMKVKPKSELALHQAKAKGQIEVQHRGPSAAAAQQANRIDNAEVGEYKPPTITLEVSQNREERGRGEENKR